MFKGERFVPLAELHEKGAHEVPVFQRKQPEKQLMTTIDVQADLPHVDMDKIGIHTTRVSRLARLGGIKTVSLRAEEGDVSKYTPNIVGSNYGIAFAAKAGSAEIVSTSSSKIESDGPTPSSSWADMTITVNTSEISERLKQNNQPVRSAEAWSDAINTAMQRDLLKRGTEQLMGGVRGPAYQLFTWGGTALDAVAWSAIIETSPYVNGAAIYLLINQMLERLDRSRYADKQTDYRHSLFWGTQVDRIAGLFAMTKKDWLLGTQSLVKPLK